MHGSNRDLYSVKYSNGKSGIKLLRKRDSNLKYCFRGNDGGRSSMVEPQIVVLVVAGSSPVGHPIF